MILERAVINLQENVLTADLQAETFYTIISEKRPEKALVQYYRWLKENQEEVESLITLKQWSATEADYQIQVTELKHGLRPGNCNWKPQEQKKINRLRSIGMKAKEKLFVRCVGRIMLTGTVMRSRVEVLKKKWATGKRLGLCYKCLGDDHLGNNCPRSRMCGLKGCPDHHHRLLHIKRTRSFAQRRLQEKQVSL